MKTPGIRNSADPDQHSRPVMLKNKGPYKVLDMTIGEIGLEVWDHYQPVAEPFVRLTVGIGSGFGEILDDKDWDDTPTFQVTLDPMHASALAQAIGVWAESFRCDVLSHEPHALNAGIESLRLRLLGPSPDHREARAEFTFIAAGHVKKTTTLTHVEAQLLAQVLWSITPDGQESSEPVS